MQYVFLFGWGLYTQMVKEIFKNPKTQKPAKIKIYPAKRQVAWRKPDPSTERELISPSSGYYHRDSDCWLKMTSVIYNKISKQRAESADELAQMLRLLWRAGEGEMREEKERERYLQIIVLLWYSSPFVLPSKLQLLELLLPSILLTASWNAALPFTDSCCSCQQHEKGKATSRCQTVTSSSKSPWSQASMAELLSSIHLSAIPHDAAFRPGEKYLENIRHNPLTQTQIHRNCSPSTDPWEWVAKVKLK